MGSRQTTRIDAYIGARIRERRVSLGLSSRELAKIIGLTAQAVQKYETADRRMSAGRLHEIAQALNSPIEYFVEGLDTGPPRIPSRQRRLLELMRNFSEIEEKHQLVVRDIIYLLNENVTEPSRRPPAFRGLFAPSVRPASQNGS